MALPRISGGEIGKFLFTGTYTSDGIRALKEVGAGSHGRAIKELVSAAGGSVEALYWAFGEEDFYLIADLPDPTAAGAITLAIGGGGSLRLKTVFLETADEVDAAFKLAGALPFRSDKSSLG